MNIIIHLIFKYKILKFNMIYIVNNININIIIKKDKINCLIYNKYFICKS